MDAAAQAFERTQGWQASLQLGFRQQARRTVLAERRRLGPLAVQRPFYPEGGVCHVYLLHPPGGVVGGDALDIDVRVGKGAQALITTPGATKFYRSSGALARQDQRLVVDPGASLEWLPQENIFFPGAQVELHTRVELQGDARLALWEIHCLGRPSISEAFDCGRIDSRTAIARNGVPLILDRLRVSTDNRSRLSLMAGLPVGGTLYLSHAGEGDVEACRDLLLVEGPDYAGATLIDDMLVVRYLGGSTERARSLFHAVWHHLRPNTLGRDASVPRIWST
ncbi:MAG: urease accessory protein UreD [Chromatiaceae bacterium]|nr:urease accessory protein UreD [Gammaproteobacteria bacterium]MCP5317275.1 urease accessory protein UreD [Chromatiaceae bacterium]MCW5587811.1 urease accessory protein UreD [Chromatiales bacterium]HOP16279.1 urease accessory protein UreD [Gammaproteobacteria bacterium]